MLKTVKSKDSSFLLCMLKYLKAVKFKYLNVCLSKIEFTVILSLKNEIKLILISSSLYMLRDHWYINEVPSAILKFLFIMFFKHLIVLRH